MKKFILLFAVLCIGVQAHAGLLPKARIGFKAGWNYQANNLKGAQDFDFNSDSGWYAGLQSEFTWGMLGIRPELVYSHNKFDVKGPVGIDGNVKMNTIDLPVLLQLRFLNFLAIQVGPSFNLMTDVGGSTQNTQWKIDRPTMGYAAGLDVRLWKLNVTARYNGSFKKSEVLGITTGENRISTFQLGLGFFF
ncbi:MAG: PorT family protein [Alistipes sp.]|nr:PorT family protein [Alistipes sp.]